MHLTTDKRSRCSGLALLLAALLLLEGCYYVQAASGQLDLLHRRRPVAEVIADANTPENLRERLKTVTEARQFAVDALHLADNESYRSYADLERDYVVWNVIAAPEFSVEPKQWCYPIAGCVAYRGYFSESSARKLAAKLSSRGFDVMVGGVPAYSTLGRFADPVLNTMMHWSDEDLVATLFHELAHQKLYIKGDTRFNESFATAVAEAGLARWRKLHGTEGEADARDGRRAGQKDMLKLALSVRDQLQGLYASGTDEESMRQQKKEIFEKLAKDAETLTGANGIDRGWLGGTLNNARLALIGLYEGRVEAFNALMQDCEADLRCFYKKAEELSRLNPEQREAELDRLEASGTSS